MSIPPPYRPRASWLAPPGRTARVGQSAWRSSPKRSTGVFALWRSASAFTVSVIPPFARRRYDGGGTEVERRYNGGRLVLSGTYAEFGSNGSGLRWRGLWLSACGCMSFSGPTGHWGCDETGTRIEMRPQPDGAGKCAGKSAGKSAVVVRTKLEGSVRSKLEKCRAGRSACCAGGD
jgi:hypothetical protein